MQQKRLQKENDNSLVQQISIASPCHVDWDSMTGDEKKRFCGDCKLNVYSVSTMSTAEAADFIRQSEGRVCMRLYRRKDGTIITDNCPVGLRKLRDRVRLKVAAVIALFAFLGLNSDAHAQATLGIILPQSAIEQERANFQAKINFCTIVASVVSSIGLLLICIKKKARPSTIGLMLLAIWALAGFAAGIATNFMPSSCGF